MADDRIPRTVEGVRLLWDDDWYDGPISGLAEFDGNEYWYETVWDSALDDWSHPRRYLLRILTSEELLEEWRWHRLFEMHVSTRHCHHDGSPPPDVRPQSEWPKFYEEYEAPDEESVRPPHSWRD